MKKALVFLLALFLVLLLLPISALSESDSTVVIAFGDSITAADKWQKYIESAYGIDIINAGVGGDTSSTAKARFAKDVLNKKPDIVLISLGINDCAIDMARYVSIADYKANMSYFISECKKIGAKVLVNIPTPVVDEQYLTRHESTPFEPYGGPNGIVSLYAEACREVAREMNVPYADLNSYFLATDDYTVYFPDGVHPSNTGYKMYASAVLDVYERLWMGDINDDGEIDQFDYILVKRAYFETVTLDKKQITRADANCDGVLDQFDYLLIRRHYFETFKLLGY